MSLCGQQFIQYRLKMYVQDSDSYFWLQDNLPAMGFDLGFSMNPERSGKITAID